MSRRAALVFDLDHTLIRPPNDESERLRRAFDRAGVEPFFTVADAERWIPKVEGESALDLRVKAFRGVASETDRSPDEAAAVARAFVPPAPEEHLPVKGAAEVVTTLRDRGYPLALVTNGAEETQRAKLAEIGVSDAFDATFFATPERGIKPAPVPFTTVLEDLDRPPSAAVSVGDGYETDVEPAKDLGMTTVWFPGDAPVEAGDAADVRVDGLDELLAEPWRSNGDSR